jgi:hypothetical protein
MRASRLCSLWPDMRPLRFRRAPFGRDGTFDLGGATASRIVMPHMLPSTVPSVSASAKFFLSWLNPPPHPITVYASHPPSPTTAQHSLPGGALPPYRGRSFTGRIASASPDAPELKVRIHSPPAVSLRTIGSSARPSQICRQWFRKHFAKEIASGAVKAEVAGRRSHSFVDPRARRWPPRRPGAGQAGHLLCQGPDGLDRGEPPTAR